jgi:hypothetical protein
LGIVSVLTTTRLVFKIQPIRDVRWTAEAAYITLLDGSLARLECHHPNFDILRIYVESDLRRQRPVGVVLDPSGKVIDLGAAHDTTVHWLRAIATDPTRFAVAFWAYSPICCLTRDHPDFERIHATVTEAAGTSQLVWVATHSKEVVEDEPDKDGLRAALPKILDVRPV